MGRVPGSTSFNSPWTIFLSRNNRPIKTRGKCLVDKIVAQDLKVGQSQSAQGPSWSKQFSKTDLFYLGNRHMELQTTWEKRATLLVMISITHQNSPPLGLTTIRPFVWIVRTVSPTVADPLWRETYGCIVGARKLWRLADGHLASLFVWLVLAVDVSVAHPVLTDAFPYSPNTTMNLKITLCVGCRINEQQQKMLFD